MKIGNSATVTTTPRNQTALSIRDGWLPFYLSELGESPPANRETCDYYIQIFPAQEPPETHPGLLDQRWEKGSIPRGCYWKCVSSIGCFVNGDLQVLYSAGGRKSVPGGMEFFLDTKVERVTNWEMTQAVALHQEDGWIRECY